MLFDDNHLKGVDAYHGDLNLSFHDLFNADVEFAWFKASQGVDMTDHAYLDSYKRAKSVGILSGAYHYFDPVADPLTQAQHFLKCAKLIEGDLPYCLDIESYGPDVSANALICANAIKKQTGVKPVIYTGDSFYQDHLCTTFSASDYTLWIARYGAKPHTACSFWQFADNGSYPNNPPLDSNVFFGNFDSLKKLCI